MPENPKPALNVLVIVTPNFNLAATVGFLDPFRASNYLDGSILFKWSIASATGGEIIASNGLSVRTKPLREVRNQPQDIVIVSSSWAPRDIQQRSAPWGTASLGARRFNTGRSRYGCFHPGGGWPA